MSVPEKKLLSEFSRHWWLEVLRGAAAVIFGIMGFVWPGLTLFVLVVMWGAYALVDGLLALIAAFYIRDHDKPMWPFIVIGLLGIAAGIVTFLWPGITALVLLMCIAAWALLMGIFQIVAAIRLRKDIEREWLLGLSGALSVVFGLLMFLSPGAGALAVIWLVAGYAVIFGALLIGFGFWLKKFSGVAPPSRYAVGHA